MDEIKNVTKIRNIIIYQGDLKNTDNKWKEKTKRMKQRAIHSPNKYYKSITCEKIKYI